jgi:putative ABC transport system substrate-binding protein
MALALTGAGTRVRARAPVARKRVGLLAGSTAAEQADFERAFLAAMAEKGWVAGKTMEIERVYSDGYGERLPELAQKLVRGGADVIVTGGSPTTIAAARATHSIPIVFSSALWPVEQGLVESFAHPGRNVTGVAITDVDVVAKRLQFLREVAPSAKRLSWIWPDFLFSLEHLAGGRVDLTALLRQAAQRTGFEVRFHALRNGQDVSALSETIGAWKTQAVTALADETQVKTIIALALRDKLPSAFPARAYVEWGGLLAYGARGINDALMARYAAGYVVRLLGGAKVAELPVEFPTAFELTINLKTAKELALTVPPSMLLAAETVR